MTSRDWSSKSTTDQRMAKIGEWPNSKWMAKIWNFPKQRMAMAIHQIVKIQIGEWPVKILSLAHPTIIKNGPWRLRTNEWPK